jgi:hypothetical protein
MSTMNGGGNRPSIPMVIGHYLDPLWPPAMIASGVVSTLLPVGSALSWTFGLVYTAVIFGALACDIFVHSSNLCERCIQAVPLNPQAAIDRDRMWLKFFHRFSSHAHLRIRATSVPVPTGLLSLLLIGMAVQLAIRLAFDPDKQMTTVVGLVTVTIPLACAFWSGYRHNRLQPWCPLCRRDDGSEVEAPDPDPSISK